MNDSTRITAEEVLAVVAKAKKACNRRNVQKWAKKIERHFDKDKPHYVPKFSLETKSCVEEIRWLASYLYIFEKYDESYEVCCLLDEIVKFTSLYTWAPTRECRMIKCTILRMRGDEEEAEKQAENVRNSDRPETLLNVWKHLRVSAMDCRKQLDFPNPDFPLTKADRNGIRQVLVCIAMECNAFIQRGALPEYHEEMRQCMEGIIEFVRRDDP